MREAIESLERFKTRFKTKSATIQLALAELHDASVPRSSKSSADTEDGSTGTSSSDGHKSLLDVLKSPQRSEFSRKRSIAVWQCHEQISTVLNDINTAHYPNVTAVVE